MSTLAWLRGPARLGAVLLSVSGFSALSALAQAPVDPAAPLPPGHPRVDIAPPGVGEEEAPGPGVPAGHPTTATREPPRDRNVAAADLVPGTVEVHVHDSVDAPMAAIAVVLLVEHQDVARGDTKTRVEATTDLAGVARFASLPRGTSYTYRVTVNRDRATFASESFRLQETAGQRILLHAFPVTSDLRQALVGLRGVVFVQPREDVFQVEVSFQILNVGTTAWVPEGVRLTLPEGAKAFRAADSAEDARVEKTPSGAIELLGTFGPGQRDVGFHFQIDNRHERTFTVRVPLPPHVAELRVVAEAGRGMTLGVDGFPETESVQGKDGSPLLMTARRLNRGDAPLSSVEITVDHLPVPSAARWYAAALAAGVALLGLAGAFRRPGTRRRGPSPTDAEEARARLLDELVALERLHRDERVGPRTYEAARAGLVDALARLGAD